MTDWTAYQLGESSDDIVIDSSEDNMLAANRLIEQAHIQIDIFTRDLEARIYNHSAVFDAIRSLVTSSPRAKVRILVIDPDFATKHGHRLIDLARHLTSYMEIRKVHEDYAANPEAFLIVDRRGLLHRKLASRYEAVVNFNDPQHAGTLTDKFDEIWERSKSHVDFKRLYI
jgi:hypothetical protein